MDPLTQAIFFPLLSALIVALLPRRAEAAIFPFGFLGTLFTLTLSLGLVGDFTPGETVYQLTFNHEWIPAYGITYFVGLDGVSLALFLLTAVLSPIAMLSAFSSVKERKKEFVICLLILETAMLGTFAALDLFLFYVFWEAVLVPMYLLIGIFGGPRRIYATLKFFLYTMAGSVLMLAAILVVYAEHKAQFHFASTAIPDLYRVSFGSATEGWLFAAFVLAFAIKIPLFPFHTWLPDAHVEAPTAGSILLAGVLLKMGGYGLIRLALPLFPNAAASAAPVLALLAVVGIVYGALVAFAQEDVKKLVAYSSVSHMGFVVLGIATLQASGITGAVFQMVAHGLSTGALFLVVGMLYERRHTRMMTDFGGLASVAPRLTTGFFVILLASIGLPGLCGFVGEFLVLSSAFQAPGLPRSAWVVGVSVLGIVLGAAYMLLFFGRVFLGGVKFEENRVLPDVNLREGFALALPVFLVVILGVKPGFLLDSIHPSVEALLGVSRLSMKVAAIFGGGG